MNKANNPRVKVAPEESKGKTSKFRKIKRRENSESRSSPQISQIIHKELETYWPSCARRITSGRTRQTKSTSSSSGIPAQGKTNERIGRILLAQGGNDMRRFQRAGRTSRTAGGANAFHIQSASSAMLSAPYHKGNGVGQSLLQENRQIPRLRFLQCSQSIVASAASELDLSKTGGCNKSFHGLDQTNDARQIFRAGPPFVFMPAAEQNRVGMQRRFDVEQARALWAREICARRRKPGPH